jgi:hypothetical protein
MQYIKYQEHNSWEGETWNFYIPTKGNEEALKLLKEKFVNIPSPHKIFDKIFDEKTVDMFVEQSECGYMSFHNKMEGKIDINSFLSLNIQELEELLYKGNLEKIGLKFVIK